MQPPVYHTVVFLHLNLPHFFSSFFFYPLLFLKGAYYTLLELYEEAGSLSVGSLKAQFAAGVSLQEHLLPAAGLELWRVGLENYSGAAVVQMNASGLTYLTRWRKAGLLDEKKNRNACVYIQIYEHEMQQHMVGEGTHVLQPDTSDSIFPSFVFPVSASFQLLLSFYLFPSSCCTLPLPLVCVKRACKVAYANTHVHEHVKPYGSLVVR